MMSAELLEDFTPRTDRSAINPQVPYHKFVESEYEQGAGHCDVCGGGPDAEIHQKPVDQMARIADALDMIASDTSSLILMADNRHRVVNALERIADALERPYRMGAFWRAWDWVAHFFARFPAK
jgi:hypothetical protein